MTSLLVTNDFPPKLGGIQSYLYELWRRLPVADATVLTNRFRGAPEWDATQPFRIVRTRIVTSGRKVRAYSARELASILARLMRRGRRGLQSRAGLEFWYERR